MTNFYTSIENQIRSDGSKGLLFDHFDNLQQAEAKFYTICAAAAISGIPYHAAFLIQDDGLIIGSKVYDRRTSDSLEGDS